MIAAVGSFSQVAIGTSVGLKSVVCVMVRAKMLMHQDSGALPAARWCLVDRCVPTGTLREHALAGIKLVSLRQ